MSVLLFGGSFDPVHNGHIAMFRAAQDALRPTESRILPVGNAWQKGRLPLASAAQRMYMLRLAFADAHLDKTTVIDTRELMREGATYTVDTLRELNTEFPQQIWHWLIGSDSFALLHTWREPQALAALTHFAVVRRADAPLVLPQVECRYQEIICAPPPVSSTLIRAAAKADAPITDFVPKPICDYIQQYQLYR